MAMIVMEFASTQKGHLDRWRNLRWRFHSMHPMIIIVASAFALRMLFVGIVFQGVAAPFGNYEQFGWEMGWVARSIALGRGFSSPFAPTTGATALVPPLYPYLLAQIFRLFGLYSASSAFAILSINSLCSALTCVPVYLLARQLQGEGVGLGAGWLWAVYPFSKYFSATRVWEYSITALLLATALWMAQNLHVRPTIPKALNLGVILGVLALSNTSVLTLYPLAIWLALHRIRKQGGAWLRGGFVIVSTMMMLILPWSLRNERVLQAHIPIRDGFWLELWAGNHGDTSDSNPAGSHPASSEVEMQRFRAAGEVGYISEKRTLAIDFVRHHRQFTVGVSARRFIRFWTGFWSFRKGYLQREPLDVPNVFFCSAVTLFMLRGVWRSWKIDREVTIPSAFLLVVFPITYYLTHVSMDYRQPIEPEIIVMVAIGIRKSARASSYAPEPRLTAVLAR